MPKNHEPSVPLLLFPLHLHIMKRYSFIVKNPHSLSLLSKNGRIFRLAKNPLPKGQKHNRFGHSIHDVA